MIDFLRGVFGLRRRSPRSRRRDVTTDLLTASIHQRANSSRAAAKATTPPMPPLVGRNRDREVPLMPPPDPRRERSSRRRKSEPLWPQINATLDQTVLVAERVIRRTLAVSFRILRWVVIIGVPVAAIAIPVTLMVHEVRGIGIEIAQIDVPDQLVVRGIDRAILGSRLADKILAVRQLTLGDPTERPAKELGGTPIEVEVTARTNIWHRTAVWIRDLFGLWTTRVTGELVIAPDNTVSLRLRVPGYGQIADVSGYTEADLDKALIAAAPEVWQIAQPRLYAWYVYQNIYQQDQVQGRLEQLRNTGRLDQASLNTVGFLLARHLLNGGRGEDALAFADNLTARAPRYAPGWYIRAMALLQLGKPQDAVEAGQKMIEVDGGSIWGRKATARLFTASGRYNEAFREVRSALRVDPEDIDAMIQESSLHSVLGRIDEGVIVARQAVEFRPSHPGVHEVLANALMAKKLLAPALAQLDIEIANHPLRLTSRMLRANVLLSVGRAEEALAEADAVLKDTPNNGQAMMIRGWSQLALGRPVPALEMMTALIAGNITSPGVLHAKAIALEMIGQRSAAIVFMRRALQQAPNNPLFLNDLNRMLNAAE
ncbi:MAG: tetratricopeptide repeat protein [Acetobacteraceae bacterium]|nr:tetratricopeptide repeat protein [Acetobacteraceae bacterium]